MFYDVMFTFQDVEADSPEEAKAKVLEEIREGQTPIRADVAELSGEGKIYDL